MSLVNRSGAQKLRESVLQQRSSERGEELKTAILRHFDDLHSLDYRDNEQIERGLIDDELNDLDRDFADVGLVDGVIMFSPSSASKCARELFFKAGRVTKDTQRAFPYQKRWTRNATAVHRAVQRDLLYAEKLLSGPRFKVSRTEDGRPAWERNIAQAVMVEHGGVKFQIYGMMDGILEYKDASRVGFEFKTKSTTIATIGDYKMREESPDHRMQTVAYSLLFGLDEFLLVYESLAKDSWTKGADARPDMRAFYVLVTDQDRGALLNKFASIADKYYNGEIPDPDFSKCLFCPFKTKCAEVGI